MYFKDRQQAGVILANMIFEKCRRKNPIVVAIPRGGVPVAQPIAYLLDAPLTIIAAKKIGAPSNPEFGIGAVSEDGQVWMDYSEILGIKIEQSEIDRSVEKSIEEMKRQTKVFQHYLKPVNFHGRVVVLVDDGLATGATMLAAIRSLKARGAVEIIVAVPLASEEGLALVKSEVHRVYSAYTPGYFTAVAKWYDDFSPVNDRQVIEILKTVNQTSGKKVSTHEVQIRANGVTLSGELSRPVDCKAWIIFAHGSGSSRKSPRNIEVSKKLNEAGFGTLLFDLLTENEAKVRSTVFDIDFLSQRLVQATRWLRSRPEWEYKPIGYFGASTGAGAALQACSMSEPNIFAVVSRGGRPDMAKQLKSVTCPVLLIVGGEDRQVIELNRSAQYLLPHSKLAIIPGASHLFEEPGALDQVMVFAKEWFEKKLFQFKREHHVVV